MELVVVQMEWSRWLSCHDARLRCLDWKERQVDGSPSHLWVLDDRLWWGLDDCVCWELDDRLCLWVLDDRLGWGDEGSSLRELDDRPCLWVLCDIVGRGFDDYSCRWRRRPCLWVLDDRLDWGLFTLWSRRPFTQMVVRLSTRKIGRASTWKTRRSSRLQHSYWLLDGWSNTRDTRLRII